MRDWLSNHLLHIGWAIFGQECECGHNRFNWLARLIGHGNWTDNLEPADRWTAIKHRAGDALLTAHAKLMPVD